MSKSENDHTGRKGPKDSQNTCQTEPPRRKRASTRTRKRKKAQKNAKPTPKPGTPEFKELCKTWYAKLADTGFKDIERPHPAKGYSTPDSWLNAKSLRSIADDYNPKRAEYFRKLTHFITHRGHAWHKKPLWRFIARLYIEGHSYRAICKQAKAKGHLVGANVYTVYKCVRALEVAADKWWARSVHGGVDLGED